VFVAAGSHRVALPAHTDRAVYTDTRSTVECRATDGSGATLSLQPVNGSFTSNQWTARWHFDTGDGQVSFACTGAGNLRIGRVPPLRTFVGGLLLAVLGPLILGMLGILVLVVTTILWVTRPPRVRRP
jgi:hypothetical protein